MHDHRLARILGWVTIGAGLSLCAAPGPLMNAFGLGERPNLGRFLGVGVPGLSKTQRLALTVFPIC